MERIHSLVGKSVDPLPVCASKPFFFFFCNPVCVFAALAAEWQLLGDER